MSNLSSRASPGTWFYDTDTENEDLAACFSLGAPHRTRPATDHGLHSLQPRHRDPISLQRHTQTGHRGAVAGFVTDLWRHAFESEEVV